MKFDLENLKSKSKKIIITTGIIATPIISSGENTKEINQINEKNSKEIKYNPVSDLDNKENIHYTIAKESLNKQKEIKISSENKKIIENIKKLEQKFSSLSKEKTEVAYGSFSIISNERLNEIDEDIPKKKFTPETAILSDIYISEISEVNLFNKIDNLKIINKDYFTIKSEQDLEKEGYLDKTNFKHYLPEYYFVIDKQQSHTDSIFIKIKIISTENLNIEEININEKLPVNDILNLEKTINEKLIPEIVQIIEDKIVQLKLIH